MLKSVVSAEKFVINADLQKYTQKKIDGLEKYIPKQSRLSAHAEVRFLQKHAKDKKQSVCEVTLHLPHENLFASETTGHMYAALDIATAHIQAQLVAYKAKYGKPHRLLRPKRTIADSDATNKTK